MGFAEKTLSEDYVERGPMPGGSVAYRRFGPNPSSTSDAIFLPAPVILGPVRS